MNLTGSLWDLLIVFGAGVAVSFTPCVYPVMPLTASCIAGVNVDGSRLKGLVLSLIFVFGLSLTYCGLAVIAALTGGVFGQFQNQPVMQAVIALLLFIFALVMWEIIPMPNFGAGLQARVRPRNVITVLMFGAASGFIVGPCTAPVLGTLLLYIGARQNVLYGVFLMFLFSYGVGFSLILVGTFSGLLSALPKSGAWLVWIKRFCGAVIFLFALFYFLRWLGVV